jgi:hypothetical protein
MLKAICDEQMRPIPFTDAMPGDAALFRIDGDPQHLALFGDYHAGGLSIIHAHLPDRKVIETRLDERWERRLIQAYALPGIG